MKVLIFLLWMLTVIPSALANPFRTQYVCVPKIEPNQEILEFRIKDQGQCQERESFLQVVPQSNGAVLLLPAGKPLTPEEQSDLDNYKRYLGVETK